MIQPPSGRNTRQISSSPKTRATTVPPSPQRSQPPPNSKVSHRWKFSPKGMNRQNDDDDLPDVDVGETVGSLRFKLVASHRPPLPRTILESSIRGRLSLPRPRLFFASSPLSFSSLVHSLNFTNPPSLFIPPPLSKGEKIRYTSDPRSRFGRTSAASWSWNLSNFIRKICYRINRLEISVIIKMIAWLVEKDRIVFVWEINFLNLRLFTLWVSFEWIHYLSSLRKELIGNFQLYSYNLCWKLLSEGTYFAIKLVDNYYNSVLDTVPRKRLLRTSNKYSRKRKTKSRYRWNVAHDLSSGITKGRIHPLLRVGAYS